MSEKGRLYHAICPLCGVTKASTLVQRPDVLYAKCQCGLIYKKWSAEPRQEPPAAEASAADFLARWPAYSKRWRHRVSKSRYQIRDVLNFVAPGSVLDIGCSLGYTIHAAHTLGLPAQGIEYDPGAANVCRSQGYVVQTGTMEALPFEAEQFQVITMKHVLEHTHTPKTALREVWRVLKPGGGLFIAVPDGRYGKSVRNPAKSRFFQPADPEHGHCIYYTPSTLARLVTDCGFTVAHVHPQLVHWTAPWPHIAAQIVTTPPRWLLQRLRESTRLRKEFWLVAVKPRGTVP